MDRRDYFFRMLVNENELDDAFSGSEDAVRNASIDTGLASEALSTTRGGIMTGLGVTNPAGLDVVLGQGAAYDDQGRRTFLDSDVTVELVQTGSTGVGQGGTPTGGVPTAPGGGLKRWVTVFITFDRDLQEERTDGTGAQVFFKRLESFRITVAQGAPLASPTEFPPVEAGKILLGDFRVTDAGTIDLIQTDRRQVWLRARSSAGVPITRVGTGFDIRGIESSDGVRGVIETLLGFYNDHVDPTVNADAHLGSSIPYDGGPNWADGTTNPPITVAGGGMDAQIDKVIGDLADTAAGSNKIGTPAVAGAVDDLTAGPLGDKIADIMGFINDRLELSASVGLQTIADGVVITTATTNEEALDATGDGTAAGIIGRGGSGAGTGVIGIGGAGVSIGVLGQSVNSAPGVKGEGSIGVEGRSISGPLPGMIASAAASDGIRAFSDSVLSRGGVFAGGGQALPGSGGAHGIEAVGGDSAGSVGVRGLAAATNRTAIFGSGGFNGVQGDGADSATTAAGRGILGRGGAGTADPATGGVGGVFVGGDGTAGNASGGAAITAFGGVGIGAGTDGHGIETTGAGTAGAGVLATAGTSGIGVDAIAPGAGAAVRGTANGSGGVGVLGISTLGSGIGVDGFAGPGASGIGVRGRGNSGATSIGVSGTVAGGTGLYGVQGIGNGGSSGAGVRGFNAGTAAGVLGENTTASGFGVVGTSVGIDGTAVLGVSNADGLVGAGVRGTTTGAGGIGVHGEGVGASSFAVRGDGTGSAATGVFGQGTGAGVVGFGAAGTSADGVIGSGGSTGGDGVAGTGQGGGHGLRGSAAAAGHGVESTGGPSGGRGGNFTGGGGGEGLRATGGTTSTFVASFRTNASPTNQAGIDVDAKGSSVGIDVDSDSGVGINCRSASAVAATFECADDSQGPIILIPTGGGSGIPTGTKVDGEMWYNDVSNQFQGFANGVVVDLSP